MPQIVMGSIYFVGAVDDKGPIKIGFTEGRAEDRLPALQTGSPVILKIISSMRGTQAGEKILHRMCWRSWSHLEWFHRDPCVMELAFADDQKRAEIQGFLLDQKDLAWIPSEVERCPVLEKMWVDIQGWVHKGFMPHAVGVGLSKALMEDL